MDKEFQDIVKQVVDKGIVEEGFENRGNEQLENEDDELNVEADKPKKKMNKIWIDGPSIFDEVDDQNLAQSKGQVYEYSEQSVEDYESNEDANEEHQSRDSFSEELKMLNTIDVSMFTEMAQFLTNCANKILNSETLDITKEQMNKVRQLPFLIGLYSNSTFGNSGSMSNDESYEGVDKDFVDTENESDLDLYNASMEEDDEEFSDRDGYDQYLENDVLEELSKELDKYEKNPKPVKETVYHKYKGKVRVISTFKDI